MENNDIIGIKKELTSFEIQKQQLLKTFNKEINNLPENIGCYMATILYEYRRLETQANLRTPLKNPMYHSAEGRTVLLLNFIKRSFNKEQIRSFLEALNQEDRNKILNDPCSITSILPSIEKLAAPVLNKINLFKRDLQELYLSYNIPFIHISPVDIQDGLINPSINLENQPQNEIMTGVFATSSYDDINLYMARAAAGSMIANTSKVQYPRNPFLLIEKQLSPDKIQLLNPVYAYALKAKGFEPQVHFAPTNNGFMLLFGNEWVKNTDIPIPFISKRTITEVDSEPFLKIDTRYVDENNNKTLSFTETFAKKFNIKIPFKNQDKKYSPER